jgi:hypothetical protein
MTTKNDILKSKMIDHGKKIGDDCCMSVPTKKKNDEKYYPSLYLNNNQAEFLKDTQVGDRKRFIIDTVLKSKTTSSYKGREDHLDVNLEIQKIGIE